MYVLWKEYQWWFDFANTCFEQKDTKALIMEDVYIVWPKMDQNNLAKNFKFYKDFILFL